MCRKQSSLALVYALLLPLVLAWGCAGQVGGAVIEGAFNAIKKTFLGVATSNYGDTYRDDFDKVLTALTSVAKQRVTSAVEEPAKPADGGSSANAGGNAAPPSPGTTGTTDSTSTTSTTSPAPAAPAQPASGALPALAVEFVLLKEGVVDGRSVPEPVADGDVLYDRFGTHGEGDNVKFRLRAATPCFVYVLSIDSTGWARPLFPSTYTAQQNPLPANTTIEVPPGENWATLDSWRGVEHVYVLASRTQRVDLESALTTLAANVRDVDPARVLEMKAKVALVAEAAPMKRGWGEARPSQFAGVKSSQGATFEVDSKIYQAKGPDDLVITRWFRHQ